jgi:tRNA threonylcarbamoyladenosine biosynthesis protein TsaB
MTQRPLILAVETSGRMGSVAIALGEQILAEADFTGPMRHSAELFPAVHDLLDRLSREPQEIEHIYISVGPGSFTGLRIAVTFAKTMHLANAAKIVAVDTLDVIAANAINLTMQNTVQNPIHEPRFTHHEKIAVILDAKRSQFFIAVYQRRSDKRQTTSDRIWEKFLPDSLMTAEQFLDKFARREKAVWLLGEGLVYYKDKFKPVPSGACPERSPEPVEGRSRRVEGTDGIKFFDEATWYPKAAKVHLLGWEKAQAAEFADPLALQPNYLRAPDIKEKGKQQKS